MPTVILGVPVRYAARCAMLLTLCIVEGALRPLAAQETCPSGALPAYAHNDYANPRPLHEAVERGFRGVEADVFLVADAVRVGHDRRAARRGGTLQALYLEPLRALVARCGRLTADGQPFLLTIEIKERSRPTYDPLVGLLRRYLVAADASRERRRPRGSGDGRSGRMASPSGGGGVRVGFLARRSVPASASGAAR